MKITIAYTEEEQREAATICEFARDLIKPEKVRRKNNHPPFRHIYLTTKKPENPCRGK